MPNPWIIAHRGDLAVAPENTLASITAALDAGAEGVEFDVHATRDGVVVVHHDPIPRAHASNPALEGRPFSTLDAAEVRGFRIDGRHHIPTLQEVLDLVQDRAWLFCELKGAGVVEVAAPLLRQHHGRCAMHAFDHRAVVRASVLAPAVPRGILLVSRLVEPLAAMRAAHATTLWPHADTVDASLVDELRSAGMDVIPWTVNAPEDGLRLAQLGVTGICTDHPRTMRQAIASTKSAAPA
jgi:glycerophosphoryl diester phosphodiesterase